MQYLLSNNANIIQNTIGPDIYFSLTNGQQNIKGYIQTLPKTAFGLKLRATLEDLKNFDEGIF